MAPIELSQKVALAKSHEFLARTERPCDIAENVSVLPINKGCKIPPFGYTTAHKLLGLGRSHLAQKISPHDPTSRQEIVFLAARVPLLLSVNHNRGV